MLRTGLLRAGIVGLCLALGTGLAAGQDGAPGDFALQLRIDYPRSDHVQAVEYRVAGGTLQVERDLGEVMEGQACELDESELARLWVAVQRVDAPSWTPAGEQRRGLPLGFEFEVTADGQTTGHRWRGLLTDERGAAFDNLREQLEQLAHPRAQARTLQFSLSSGEGPYNYEVEVHDDTAGLWAKWRLETYRGVEEGERTLTLEQFDRLWACVGEGDLFDFEVQPHPEDEAMLMDYGVHDLTLTDGERTHTFRWYQPLIDGEHVDALTDLLSQLRR